MIKNIDSFLFFLVYFLFALFLRSVASFWVGVRCFSECLSAPLRPFFLFAPLYTLFLNIPNSLVKNKIVFRNIRIFAHDLMYKEHRELIFKNTK